MHNAPRGALSRNHLVALVLFIFCCLLSTARILRQAPKPEQLQADDIALRSDRRFATVKQLLPTHGVVGYIGEPGDSSLPDYYLAQYALAPLVVDRSVQHQLIIGNFPSLQVPVLSPRLREIKDLGDGVVLIQNEDVH